MAHDVFISHSSHDKALAEQLVTILEKNNIRCWAAMRDALYGPTYAKQIVEAIKNSRMVVLVFSVHANDSPHIIREVEQAVDRRIPVVTMRVQDIVPGDDMGYFLKVGNWMDAFHGPFEAHATKLAEQVRTALGQPREPSAAPAAAAPAPAAPPAAPAPITPRPTISAPAGALEPPSLAERAADHAGDKPKTKTQTEKDTQITVSSGRRLKSISIILSFAAAVAICAFIVRDEMFKPAPAAPSAGSEIAVPIEETHLTADQVADQIDGELKPVNAIKIATTAITRRQFDAFVHAQGAGYTTQAEKDANPNTWRTANDDDPALYISWNEAQSFIKWLNDSGHRKYRLPTEQEWSDALKTGDAHAGLIWLWSADSFSGASDTGTQPAAPLKVICRAAGNGTVEHYPWPSDHGLSTVGFRLAED